MGGFGGWGLGGGCGVEGGGKRLKVVMVTVGDGFAPLGPPMLPWEMHIKMGQQRTDFATTRPNRTGEKSSKCLELE